MIAINFSIQQFFYLFFFQHTTMSESNTVIGINFGTAYTSIAYLNKVIRL